MYMKPLSNIVLKSVTCQTNKQEILHTWARQQKKNREFFFQLVYIIQVKSVDKAVSGRVLNYSSNLFIWKINKKLSAM